MRRIIGASLINGQWLGGIEMESFYPPNTWDASIFEVNGHREVSVRPVVQWVEIFDRGTNYLDNDTEEAHQGRIEEKRLRSLEKASKRAATQCRRSIKAGNFNEMLTITYRENQTDRALCKKHLKEWVRRMKRALPDFQYCAAVEAQDRGAMHVHVATHKLPQHAQYKGVKIEAWKLGTKIWRSIVGENNGLVFVGGKTKFGSHARRPMSLAKIAAYVSKYITKAYADSPMGSNRYSRSDDLHPPKPQKIRFADWSMAEVITCLFECPDGHALVSHRVGLFKDSYWLCTEPKCSQ
jgi:hypothetical protein